MTQLAVTTEAAPAATMTSQCHALRVLLIDDDPVFRSLCKRLLADESGRYDITEAENAQDASAIYERQRFDCVLVDYRLPDMTSTIVMRTLQPSPDPAVPMIVLTAAGSEEIAVESWQNGAADYLPKGTVNRKSLRRAIANAVEKARLHESIQQRNEQLERAVAKLREKNAEIGRFYHTVSHEIKTPLTAAREFIALVYDGIVGEVSEQQRELLAHAIDSCDQIAQHFNDLIESARLETGKFVLRKTLVPIDSALARAAMSVVPAVEAKGLSFTRTVEPGLPKVHIDAGRIVQVLSNLLGNAVKYTAPRGTISLAARLRNDSVEVEIRDTGCGIEDKHLPRIFDRLYQVQPKGDELMGAGLGLGLSIAKDIVELHGGSITVASEVGKGATFTVRLPVPDNEGGPTSERMTSDEDRTAH